MILLLLRVALLLTVNLSARLVWNRMLQALQVAAPEILRLRLVRPQISLYNYHCSRRLSDVKSAGLKIN
jgi:hypothetical protein